MAPPEPNWAGSEEDHAFRSHAIQWLLQNGTGEAAVGCPANRGPAIPRVIVQYWHDLDALPADVAECLHSWKLLEKDGFEVELFDDARAGHFIAANYGPRHVTAFRRCYHPAMRCDYLRLCFILKLGGFYVDADEVYCDWGCEQLFRDGTLKLQPLCYDTSTHQMVEPDIFLTDTVFPSSRIFYVNNNPIVAPPGHALLRAALQRSTDLLSRAADRLEIQSTTGPGNLSAILVRHAADLRRAGVPWDFTIVRDWPSVSECRWFLSYRNDERNWRLIKSEGE